jgi:pyruvate dehydrogenase E1 component alpha subunit
MLHVRLVEEAIADRYSEWKMRCPTHLCIGQEAVATGVCAALRSSDFAVSGHRAHGHYLAKGGSLERMLAEIYGKATGCCAGKGGSMHLVDLEAGFMGSTAIVGGTIPVGVGLALSISLQAGDDVSVVFLGDGAVEEGVFYESANFAALKKLPVLFVCENNHYSVYSPLDVRQPPGRRIYEMVAALGLDSTHVHGNDVTDVYRAAETAVSEIRSGRGPKFIELETYRWREHCGPNYDNDIGYRTPEEFAEWKARDPLVVSRQRIGADVLDDAAIDRMSAEIRAQIDAAFDFAERSPFPEPRAAFDDVVKA